MNHSRPLPYELTGVYSQGFTGTTSTPPTTFTALTLANGGRDATFVVGGATASQTDPDLGTGQPFRYPLFGSRAARVNFKDAADSGRSKNSNALRQTMTVTYADVDPLDGLPHVRFALAPVLENPAHNFTEQPYYFVELTNLTRGTKLFGKFNVGGQAGVPWRTTTSVLTGTTVQWTDWTLFDLAPGSAALAVGDQVQLSVIATGCKLGSHFGRVYVDGFGGTVPGLYTWATAPQSVSPGSTLTYTVYYRNGGSTTTVGTALDFATPPQTTFASTTGASCTAPAAGSTGTVSCSLGSLAPGASGSYTVTVNVAASATGSIVAGTYSIYAANARALLGPKVETSVPSSATTYADMAVTGSGPTSTNWGATSVQFTIVAKNLSTAVSINRRNAPTFSVTFPPELTNVSWTCVATGTGSGSNSPYCDATTSTTNITTPRTGNISVRPRTNGTGNAATFTVTATIVAGSGNGVIRIPASITAAVGTPDSNLVNNDLVISTPVGAPRALTVTTVNGSAGSVASAPAGIACGSTCTGSYADGTSVTLTATPAAGGATFTGWSGACTGANPTCTVEMTADRAVTATFAAAPVAGPVSAIYALRGSGQAARTSTAFGTSLKALVVDAAGIPLSGKSVTFAAPASGASATLSATTATTDASGIATITTATANATAGTYDVTASVTAGGGGTVAAPFALTNVGPPAAITYVQGGSATDPQTAIVSTEFGARLVALVTDAAGTPVPGVTVTYTAPATGATATLKASSGGAAASTQTAVTDSFGQASMIAVASATSGGPYTVSATVSGIATPAAFSLQNTVATPAAVYVVSGSPQVTATGSAFGSPLVAVVADAVGNAIPNVTVTFTAPASGATASLTGATTGATVTATTDASGLATVTATANATGGTYNVTASVAGIATPATFTLTNDGGFTLSVVTGSGQSAAVGAAFVTPLKVQLLDAAGAVASGATITFSAPATGASATLSATTATTDASGFAQITATANTTTGSFQVTATNPNAGTPGTFALTNTVGPAAKVTVASGSPQTTSISAAFSSPLVVLVTDTYDNPISGATVTFTAPGSGASATLSQTTATTDATGTASITATANASVGTYDVTASVTGVANPASFSLTNTAGAPATLTVVAGDRQSAAVTLAYVDPVVLRATDMFGNVVAGATVTAKVPLAGPTVALATSSVTTNADGEASFTAVAGIRAGTATVTVASGTATATFSLDVRPGALAALTPDAESASMAAQVLTAFAAPLAVTATDAFGNGIADLELAYAAPLTGATATLDASTATTDALGRAAVPAVAGATAGTYAVTVTFATASTPTATFVLTNLSGAPASITVGGGAPATAVVGAPYASPLTAVVRDALDNPIPGVLVTFQAPGTGASVSLDTATAITDVDGRAQVNATANTVAGPFAVSARITQASQPATFDLTNLPGAAAQITADILSTPQAAQVGTSFARDLSVEVVDQFGNLVPGATVTWTAPTQPATALLAATTSTTDVDGRAAVSAQASDVAGGYQVQARVAGVATPAAFALLNTAGAPSAIELVSGAAQQATVGTAFAAPLVVRVHDGLGNAIAGATVVFAAPGQGASATLTTSVTTGPDGTAATTALANAMAGDYVVTATTAGAATGVAIPLTNLGGAAATLTADVGATPQTALVGQAFGVPLGVHVTDAFGNPVAGVEITFTVPATDPTAILAAGAATTDTAGYAAVTAIASAVPGTYEVVATISGVASPATFTLTQTAVTPGVIRLVSGGGQSALATATFGAPVVFSVSTADGNLVEGATVSLTTSGPGLVLTTMTAVTDATGQVYVAVAAGTIAGDFTLGASASGVATPATATLHVDLVPTSITLTPPPGVVAPDEPLGLEATVSAELGVPVGTVTFLVDGVERATAPVDADGIAAVEIAGLALGAHTVVARFEASDTFASATSTAVPLEVDSGGRLEGGGGCSTTDADGRGWVSLLVVCVVALVRRRGRRGPVVPR